MIDVGIIVDIAVLMCMHSCKNMLFNFLLLTFGLSHHDIIYRLCCDVGILALAFIIMSVVETVNAPG